MLIYLTICLVCAFAYALGGLGRVILHGFVIDFITGFMLWPWGVILGIKLVIRGKR